MMKKRLYNYFRNLSIYSRVHRMNLLIAITPLLLITAVSIVIYATSSTRRLAENEATSLFYYTSSIANTLFSFDSEITKISRGEAVQDILDDYLIMSELEKYKATQEVADEFSAQLHMLNYVTDVVLVTNKYVPINVSNGPHDDFELEGLDFEAIIRDVIHHTEKASFTDTRNYKTERASEYNNHGFLYIRRIVDTNTASINMGYLVAYIDKEQFFKFASSLNTEFGSYTDNYILSRGGDIIYSTSDAQSDYSNPALASEIERREKRGEQFFYLNDAVKGYHMYAFDRIDACDWFVVTLIPYSIFMSDLLVVAIALLLFMLLLLLMSAYLSAGIAKSISTPVFDLVGSLKAVQNNDFSVESDDPHTDELADLRNMLNRTTERLVELLDKVQLVERQKFDLQFKALQTQINPHFLMNTLNTVVWLADIQGVDNIKTLTGSLISILSQVVRRTDSLISIAQEADLLGKYVTIQKFRYFERFTVDVKVEPSLLTNRIPYFVLQPLVENCLIHAMDDSIPILHICIHIYANADNLLLEVQDDGMGMSEAALERYASEGEEDNKGSVSVGIQNINRRVQLIYGKQYGLSFHVRPAQGTIARITLPRKLTEDRK